MFSVVITTYNRKDKVSDSIDNVLGQTHKNFEVIVVDDGSTDGTNDLLREKYGQKIKYIELSQNRGSSYARNKGISEARGDLILVWDSDDILYPEALARVKEVFDIHPDIGIVSAPAIPVKNNRKISYENLGSGFISLDQILCKYLPNNEKVRVFKKDLFSDIEYQSKNIDFMVNGYLAEKAKWYHISEPLGELRIEGDDSLTKTRKTKDANLSIERSFYLETYLNKFGGRIIKNCPGRYAAYSYGVAMGKLLGGDRDSAKYWSSQAVKFDSAVIRHLVLWILCRLFSGRSIVRFLFKIL